MRYHTRCLLAAASSLALAQSGYAVIGFDVVEGDYHVATNWAEMVTGDPTNNYSGPNLAPTPSLDVRIANGGVATVRAGHTADEGGANQFEIAYAANTSGTLIIDPGARFAPRFDIRVGGNNSTDSSPNMRTGVLTNNGGTVTGSNLILGFGRSSSGTFNMNGGTLTLDNLVTSNTFLYVGSRGRTDTNALSQATLNHTAGDIILTDDVADRVDLALVRLGNTGAGANRNAGPATYDLSGGTLNTPNLQYGSHDTGVGSNTFKLRGTGEVTTRRITVLNPTATNTFEFNGGTLKAGISNDTFMQGLTTANVMAGGAKIDTNGFNVTVAQALTTDPALTEADGGLTKSGAGTLTLSAANTHTGGTTVSAGTLVAANADAIGVNRVLTVASGATARVQTGLSTALDVSALTIASAGKLDLNDDAVVRRNVSGQNGQFATRQVTALLKSGLENGGNFDWLGNGVSSTEANADNATAGSVLFGLGVVQNNLAAAGAMDGTTTDETAGNTIYTTFKGRAVGLNDTLVRYTYMGDADLSGNIDGTDYSLIDAGFGAGLSGWINGDFDYSGSIDGTDYALIDNAFGAQAGVLSEEYHAMIADHAALFGQSYVDALAAVQSGVVPEPATLGVLGIAGLGMAAKRRDRRSRSSHSWTLTV